ncbi:hypothetical protein IW261DRAFT_1501417 [Armillaria novae-zelandiae]|uniref:Uncharacterized protein n=1 Tax=Armillaria novae-zelandiae TaxID=153914 RepID=A0AA39NYN9_9AGAR|nr:hypothetical protein IW261DRAFT_1520770 [Armillaria novae-zelandiae]KAK0474095.1 hypothetical protein IW261DRAFT_1501135 [Armillaria novae-zelandiae]KAK0474105.1 hypothetical protein IW261DRAFT_1501417 [Armillaria novae-zelandiae]
MAVHRIRAAITAFRVLLPSSSELGDISLIRITPEWAINDSDNKIPQVQLIFGKCSGMKSTEHKWATRKPVEVSLLAGKQEGNC